MMEITEQLTQAPAKAQEQEGQTLAQANEADHQ